MQGAALVAAETDQGVRRAAVEEDRHVYSPGHGQIGSGAALEVVEGEHVALFYGKNLPGRGLFAVDLRRHLRSGDGDDGVLRELKLRAEVGYLQSRRALLVAHQVVASLIGEQVHRPRGRHPDIVVAQAARVLDGRKKARLFDLNRHRAPPESPRCTRAGPPARGPRES